MAVDFREDQLDTVSKLQNIAATILDQLALAKRITQEAIDKGYSPGTPVTGITDALLQTAATSAGAAPFPDLAAADVTAGVAAINAIDATLAATTRLHYKALARLR